MAFTRPKRSTAEGGRSFEAVEFLALEWIDWFNHRRLLAPIDPAGFAEVALSVPNFGSAHALLWLSPAADLGPCGQIGIELSSGIRLKVDGAVDGDALARVLAVLGR